MRICQKLPLCPTELVLPKAESMSNGGRTSGIPSGSDPWLLGHFLCIPPGLPVLGSFLHYFVLCLFLFVLVIDVVIFPHGQNLPPNCVNAGFHSPFKYQLFTH